MKNVSSQFRRELNNGNRNYVKSAKITLKDETELTLTDKVFWNNGVKIEESTSNENSFDIGSVIVGQLTLSINNMYDDYSEYDFTDAKITNVSIGIKLSDNTIESLQYGQYTVNEAKYNGSIITLTAYDNMYKFDQPYTKSTLSYPATLLQIVQDSCSKCDVQLGSYDFPHNDFIIQNKPEDESITFRNILQWVAQISCCYCKMDPQGRLVLNWYNTDILENISTLNGGNFLNWEANKDTVSGGNFNPWTQGELISAGAFSETSDYHTIHSFSSLTLSTDDVVITGVRVVEEIEGEEGTESKTYQSGMDGYVLSVEGNKLIQGSGATVVGFLAEKLVGLRFRPFTASSLSDPTIESGDIALLSDRKGNTYKTIITSNTFQPGNYQNISCGAEAPARKSAQRYSQATQIYVDYRKEIQKERTEREKALEELGERLEASTGVFTTIEEQSDGSKIYYLHNKPSLDDSDIVWKMTAEAWGVSTDGGKTWNAGMTVDGDTIVRILTATGVNADWIKTGALQISDTDGNIIFLADMDTKQIIISGDYVQIGGKTAGAAINDALQESKDYSDGKLADFADTVTGDLSSIQAQIDGQIETFYEDYEPSLQNYPANEWTSTEERKKHEGDLFYWKSKGYAYRFFQDGATWKWQLVQDTDITQAMEAAEKAQDTADGKRRVFVTTPQPPYDIGDLWTNGEDILTCSTARSAGSVYVSTDWKKLNTYTDDTVANEALEEARKARNLNIILDNEYQGIYADSNGNIGTFPTVQTTVQVLYGHTDVSVDCTYSIAKSSGVTGSWSNAARMYTVTGLSTDSGWVDITASYLNLFTATKRFNVEKIKGGTNGKDGETGKGIKSVTNHYLATSSSSGVTTSTSGWTTTVQTITASKKYLWNYETITYTDNSTTNTTPCIIGTYGEKGANGDVGNGIASITEHYAVSSSNTTAPASWSTTVPTMTKTNKYLWNYETIKYTNGNSVNTTKRVIGVYGDTGPAGTNGKGIKSVTNRYLATNASSGVTTGTSGWTTTVQTITASKKYLWNYETITYTDNSTTNTTPCIIGTYGEKGANGDVGNGIASITEHYAVSSSNTTAPASWSSTVPAMTKTNRYLWNYETIKYTNGTSVNTAKRVIGVYGDTGENGEDGTPGRTYMIEPSVNILKRSKDDTISPNFVEFKSYYRDGNSATRTAYSGRWIIEETSDGDEWTTIYTSSANESSVKHYLYSMLADSDGSAIANSNGDTIGIPRDVVAIRAKLYASGGTTNLLDMQSIAVVVDVDALTHEEIFNLLTNNGEVKGIYQEGNQLYISFTYAKGGELTLGGSGNGNGKLKILNASGTQIGYIDNTGVHFNQGTFSGNLSAAGGTFKGALQAATGTFSGNLSAAGGTFKGALQAAGGTFSGSLQAARGTFSGSITVGGDSSGIINIKNSNNVTIGTISESGVILSGSSGNPYFIVNSSSGNTQVSISGSGVRCYNGTSSYIVMEGGTIPYLSILDSNGNSTSVRGTRISTDGSLSIGGTSSFGEYATFEQSIVANSSITCKGTLTVSGYKNRLVETDNYDERLLYSYEMPSPMFGDIGEATTDENGECYLFLDDIFQETVTTSIEYQVFLQKEGQGDIWVEEKAEQYFLVKGTPNLKFAWEVKVKQKDYEYERLEAYRANPETEKLDYEAEGTKVVDLITQKYIENSEFNVTNYYRELEGMFT